jgi:hypothetical protein
MRVIALALLCLLLPSSGLADGSARPDGHAPIGVMGDHLHPAGGMMLSYRFTRVRMSGNRDGTRHLSKGDVFDEGFMVSPTDMDVNIHRFGAMFAPTDWLTLMGMLPFIEKEMDHVTAMGGAFETQSDDVGDLRIFGLWRLWDDPVHRVHLHTGVGFPTGSIGERDTTMGPDRVLLPYAMQIGSGSYELLPGLTYTGEGDVLSFGAQAMGTLRLGENDHHYRLGDRVDLTAWLAHPFTSWLSSSLRLAWSYEGNIRGADPALNPAMVPTADPDRRAGHRLDVLPGLNFVLPLGPLGQHRLAIEAGFPVYQWLDGPQLETDWHVTVGWQTAFSLFGH